MTPLFFVVVIIVHLNSVIIVHLNGKLHTCTTFEHSSSPLFNYIIIFSSSTSKECNPGLPE